MKFNSIPENLYLNNIDNLTFEDVGLLEEFLIECNKVYYGLDNQERDTSLISDYHYDKLYEKLAELKPNSEVITKVGESLTGLADTELEGEDFFLRTAPMKSIKPIFEAKDIQGWYSGLEPKPRTLIFSLKEDGISFRAIYKKGKLVRANSRGRNNSAGYNLTRHLSLLLPNKIDVTEDLVEVRGEIVLPYVKFKELQDRYPEKNFNNPRNSVMSLLKEDALDEDIKLLKPIAYNIYGLDCSTMEEKLDTLSELKFNTVPHLVVNVEKVAESDIVDLVLAVVNKFGENIDNFGNKSDGVVVSVNELDLLETLGGDVKYNNGVRALKILQWGSKVYRAKVISIDWSYGTKEISPVAVIEPTVTESNQTVTRVNIGNVERLERAKAYPGNYIEFEYVSEMNPKLIVIE